MALVPAAGSYDDRLITDRDRLRAMVGDTQADSFLLSNDHLDAVLSIQGTLGSALAFCCDELIARFANEPVVWSSQGESTDFRERIATWRLISAQAKANGATPGHQSFQFVKATYGNPTTDEYSQGTRYR